MMKKHITILGLLFVSLIQSQNKFLDYDFWKKNPTIETIEALIAKGNSVTEKNTRAMDGITYAILGNTDAKTIKHLIEKQKIDVNTITHDERTYIFWAGYKGNLELVEFLLKKGAKTDVRDDKGNSITQFTTRGGVSDTKIYDLLFKNGLNPKEVTKDGRNLAHLYAQNMKNLNLLEYFSKKGIDILALDKNENGIFNFATVNRDVNILKQLIAKKAPTNLTSKNKENAFYFLTKGKFRGGNKLTLETVKYLENLGISPNFVTTSNENALHNLAFSVKNPKIITYFTNKGLNVNLTDDKGNTPFMNASFMNNKEVLEILSKGLKNINQQNKDGHSALTIAIRRNKPEIVEYLLKKGANISVKDNKKQSLAYHLVDAFRGNINDFKKKATLLTEKGLSLNEKLKSDNTLLHNAVKNEKLELVKELINLKLDVNAKNNENVTPLHLASMMNKNTDIIKFLLSVGADKNSKTIMGETAYKLASENEVFKKKKIDITFLK